MLTLLKAENGSLTGEFQNSFDEVNNNLAQKENGRKSLIDYILVRNAKAIRKIERYVFVLKDHLKNNYSDLSDHYGIEADVNFDNRPYFALSRLHP